MTQRTTARHRATANIETGPDHIRRERDRFAAFSFCVADVLIELDDSQTVVFATGAVQALLQKPETALIGVPLAEIATPEYAGLVTAVLSGARSQNRMSPAAIRLKGANGPTPPMQTTGYYLPDLPAVGGRYYLAMRLDADLIGPARNRDSESGLLDTDGFANNVSRQLGRDLDADLKVTLVQVGNLEGLRRKLDGETRKTLMATIGAYLRANSIGGDAAGQIDDERFGLLRDGSVSIAPVWRQLREFTRRIDPDGVGLDIADADFDPAEIGLTGKDMSPRDIARVLIHAVNAFDTEDVDDVNLDDIARDIGSIARGTVERIGRFRSLIEDGAFVPAFQPIVDAATGRPHHFEALARFPADADLNPGEEIRFAEDLGLIAEFDLKMTRKVIDWLQQTNKHGMRYHIAVNLSGRSLASKEFVASLMAMLAQAADVGPQIMFELTETSRIANTGKASSVIAQLRRLGHLICLDDFGAGAATFHYLRAFDVDIVKLDGALVHEALTGRKGKAFLNAVTAMCADLGIVTVAEQIEDERMLKAVREAGVRLAQGNLFGTPSIDVGAFDAPRLSCFEGRSQRRTG